MTQTRKLWLQLFAVAALAGIAGGSGTAVLITSIDMSGPRHYAEHDYLKAKSLHITDEQGNTRIRLSGDAMSPTGEKAYGIWMGRNGEARLMLTVGTSKTVEGPALTMLNTKGQTTAMLAHTLYGPTIVMQDHERGAEYSLVPHEGTFVNGADWKGASTQPPRSGSASQAP